VNLCKFTFHMRSQSFRQRQKYVSIEKMKFDAPRGVTLDFLDLAHLVRFFWLNMMIMVKLLWNVFPGQMMTKTKKLFCKS